MRYSRMVSLIGAGTLVVVACVVPRNATAQSIASRVASAGTGKVRFTFAAKPDVCGMGNSISRGNNLRNNWSDKESPDVEYDLECGSDPVRTVLEVQNGRVTKVRTYVGGRWRPASSGVTDLGNVSVRQATDYLLSLAATADGSVARDAIMPATLADSVVIWPALMKIARDEGRPDGSRKQALFWVAQAAGDRVAGPAPERKDEDSEIRKQAVFALSQRRNDEAVGALIQVARNNRDPEVRRTAMFWLGQRTDPRVIAFFDEILRR